MEQNMAEAITGFIIQSAAAAEGREYFRQPLAGFSAADDPLFGQAVTIVGPHLKLPQDFLSNVKTVISFFIPFQKEIVEANRARKPVSELWGRSYVVTNKFINALNQSLVDFLTRQGFEAAAVPATHNYDKESLKAAWSHRSAALAAGLGRFGLNRMLITRLGCAGRYGTVFTSAEIPATPRPDEEPCLYFQKGSCQACLKACPVSALSPDTFERFTCNSHLAENSKFLSTLGIQADCCGQCVTAGPCAFKE